VGAEPIPLAFPLGKSIKHVCAPHLDEAKGGGSVYYRSPGSTDLAKIAARILELKERAAVRAEVTTQSLIDQAEQVSLLASRCSLVAT